MSASSPPPNDARPLPRERQQELPGFGEVLHGVSLEIEQRELVAVVGPSGSGKTTLLSIMGTLEQPSSGTVRLAGEDARAMTDAHLSALRAEHIGFVFQQFFLIDSVSALENVMNGLLYRGLSRSRRRGLALSALQRVGLGHRLDHRPAPALRRRTATSRDRPRDRRRADVLLADEPTGNLDSHTGAEIVELLRRLWSDGATVVVITHNPEVAAATRRRLRDQRRRDRRRHGTGMSTGRISAGDLARLGIAGLTARRLRTGLSALGIAIGIASIVAVLSLSQASKADLIAQLDALGTNLLEVTPGSSPTGAPVPLSPGRGSDDPADRTGRTRNRPHGTRRGRAPQPARPRRKPKAPASPPQATEPRPTAPTLRTTLHAGRAHSSTRATERLPSGRARIPSTAERLGITHGSTPQEFVLIGSQPVHWSLGLLDPLPLTPTD